jgi:hypothetical protein
MRISMRAQIFSSTKHQGRLGGKPSGGRGRFLFLLVLFPLGSGAGAQGLISPLGTDSVPKLGSTGGMSPPAQLPIISGTQKAGARVHLGPNGKPCLAIQGYAQKQIINPDIFDHMIMASNDCSQPIKAQVCYYQTQQCVPLDVPGYGRKEIVLGIMPAMNQFQFEYREQFDQGMGGVWGGFH